MTPRFLNLASYRSWRKSASGLMVACLMCLGLPVQSATVNWTAGSTTDFLWNTPTNWSLGAAPTAIDLVTLPLGFPNPGVLPNPNIITLGAGSAASLVNFKDNYTLNGGDLTAGSFDVDLGVTGTIGSQLTGALGLTKTGGGTIRLTNASNNYTGTTTISDGSVVISNAAALGADPSAIIVSGSATRGFGGGALVLEGGYGTGMTLSRDVSLQALGPITDRSAALGSVGNNTLSGTVNTGVGVLNTRLTSAGGTLTLGGTLNVNGTLATTITILGGVNQAGPGHFSLTGTLTGTGTLEKNGSGTLFFDPSSAAGFSGAIRTTASATGNQNSVRVTNSTFLGTNTGTGANSVVDLNTGIFEVLMDAPVLQSGATPAAANVYSRSTTNSNFVLDHSPGGTAISGTLTLGNFGFAAGALTTFASRNGYGITFGAAPVVTGDANPTITNSLAGGGVLTFTGAFWSNTNNAAARTMTIAGTGNTLISGNITASAAAFDHVVTKTGTGTLTVTGTAATLDGNMNINGGTLAVTDFRSINMHTGSANTGALNLGTGTTSGTLTVGVAGSTPTAAGLTLGRTLNLASTTAALAVNASQPGLNPVIIGTVATTAAGAKTLTLGGTNTLDNAINGVLADNSGALTLVKTDPGTWVLGGNNTYTGTTTISGGTLKLRASAAASNIIASTGAVTFNANATTQMAGGTLEFAGQNGVTNLETLGALTPTAGMGTVRLSPGTGGSASLTFASLGTVNNAAGVNIVSPGGSSIVTLTGQGATTATTLPGQGKIYINGADFARINASAQVVTPVYGTDTGFVNAPASLTAASHNLLTGSYSQGAVNISSLKLTTQTLTLTGFLGVKTSNANDSGGILQTGGTGTIAGTGVGTGAGSGSLVIRVNGAGDVLNLDAPITTTTGGLTKNGAGTLVLSSAANAQTGGTTINEGTIRLTGSGVLGAASQDLTIRQAGTLTLNGVSTGSAIKNLVGAGTITNASATPATLTVGNGTPAASTFSGVIQDGGAGALSVVKRGTANFTFSGTSSYTGSTTIESTGALIVNTLADIGQPSGIGAGLGTNDTTNAGSLVFQGPGTSPTPTLQYAGANSVSTNRLFTLDMSTPGSIAQIVNNSATNAALVFRSTVAIPFGVNAASTPQTLSLGGSSTADSVFAPQLTDNGANATALIKTGAGNWMLTNNANSYSGQTRVDQGALGVTANAASIPAASNLFLNGGQIETSGAIGRTVGTGAGNVQITTGGFSAVGGPLTVNWGSTPTWNSTPGFALGNLVLNSATALSEVIVASGFNLSLGSGSTPTVSTTNASPIVTITTGDTSTMAIGQTITGTNIPAGATIVNILSPASFQISANATATGPGIVATVVGVGGRQIVVNDNANTGADFATVTGAIGGTGNLIKGGTGILELAGANNYVGTTAVTAGTLVVSSLGNSAVPGTSNVGDTAAANTAGSAVTLGNGGTTGGLLQYVGTGETSNRMIRLNTTTGANQIHADGSGALVLTNVLNDMTGGAKVLNLRGTNTAGNMITSTLTDNGGTLGVTVDGGATWILTAANSMTGTVTASAGALGIGNDAALGTGTIVLSNSSVFAHGGDRTVANNLSHNNNTTQAFIGDYSLNFTGTYANLSAANNNVITNTIATGDTLSLNNLTSDAITAARTLTFNGTGDTVVNGNITTTTAFNLNVTYSGTGSLTLGGTGTDWNAGTLTVSSGTLRLGNSEVIPHGVSLTDSGNVVLSPAAAVTATLDLNGKVETINGLTGTSAGTMVINNSSASFSALTVGANDQPVTFNGSITRTGGGSLALGKTGTAIATFSGPADITAMNVQGGQLRLNGGLTSPNLITSVTVAGGATLQLFDGSGTPLPNLVSLDLGSGAGIATLELEAGTTTDTLTTSNAANTANGVHFNIRDAGLTAGSTYPLLVAPSGLSGAAYTLGAIGGYTGSTLSVEDNLVRLILGTAVSGDFYWTGLSGTQWNTVDGTGNGLNWATNKPGTVLGNTVPGADITVIFQANNATVSPLATTLEQNFRIKNMIVETSTTPLTALSIGPGAVATSRLTVQPALATDGIEIKTGAAAGVAITAPFAAGSAQTWTVADFTSQALTGGATTSGNTNVVVASTTGLVPGMQIVGPGIPTGAIITAVVDATNFTISANATQTGTGQAYTATSALSFTGGMSGSGNITKAGLGRAVLAGAGSTYTGTAVNITGGILETQNVTALGGVAATPGTGAAITIGSGAQFRHNSSTAGTVANPLVLNGGALTSGGFTTAATTLALTAINHTYSGNVSVAANSTIHLAELGNHAALAHTITMPGVFSGAGMLTIDSVPTVSGGNQLGGNLVINGANSGWSGGLNFLRGTVTTNNVDGIGTGPINFAFGRMNFQGLNSAVYNLANPITYNAGAIGEIGVDNNSGTVSAPFTINFSGALNLGAAAGMRIFLNDGPNSVANFSGPVTLNGDASISVGGTTAGGIATISSIISEVSGPRALAVNDDLGGWATTNRTLRLTGLNTFTGNVTLGEGILEFDTVTDAGGAASSLGQGTALTTGAATLSFIGGVSQATNRPITQTGGTTLAANGTSGATITYTGAIAGGASSLTLDGTGTGFLSGVLTQTAGGTNDLNKNGTGTWTLTATNTMADDILVNAGTLNINASQAPADDIVVTGATSIVNVNVANAHQGDDFFIRNGAVVNLGINGALSTAGMDALNIAENAAAASAAVLDLKGFTSSVGVATVGFENSAAGQIVDSVGGGVLTAASYAVRNGVASANLAGAGGVTKTGSGVFTLSGTNTFAGASTVTEGELILDYTTNNTSKIAAGVGLTLGGAAGDLNSRITFNGNATAPSTQAFTTLTVVNGASDFVPVSNGGQAMNVNFTTITRTAAGGTVDFTLPAVGNITTTQALTNGILGGYATVNGGTAFATKDGSNNIIPFVATVKDNVSTWLAADNVTDSTGYTGSVTADCAQVNSITFTQPGSTVAVGSKLGVSSGGILVTSTATGAGISGGQLAAGTPDIIVTQNAAGDFTIGSAITGATSVTKVGPGALVLSGQNTSTGAINITEGIVKVSGGNAIGDTAAVNFKEIAGSGLTLLSNETVGNLTGGTAVNTIALGSNTLTTNNSAALTYSGAITGSGSFVKQGTANLALSTVSNTGFTGTVAVNQGLLFVNGNGVANLPAVTGLTVNSGGSFLVDNNGATTIPDRVNNAAPVTLASFGNGAFFGIHMRGDQDVSATESLGTVTLAGGSSSVAVNQNGGTDRTSNLTLAGINRQSNATLFVDGRNLAVTTGNNRGRVFSTAAPAVVGGTGVAGAATPATNVPVVRFVVTLQNANSVAIADVPNTFANYNATTGFTPLNIATEYRLDAAGYTASADATDNLRFTTGATGLVTKTFNTAVFDSTAGAMTVSGAGAGNALTIGSGAMLFTSTVLANGTTLDGFDSITPAAGAGNEWIITTANTTATINSVLADGPAATVLTKSGSGTLVLGANNTYTGGTVFNQGVVQADTLARLGTAGDLRFQGGTLRFGGVFDPSARNMFFGTGGATLDTNGNAITVANAIGGGGSGALTKTGGGTLTLGAAVTYTGLTTVTDGTLQYGVANALPATGSVTVNGAAAALDLAAHAVTLGTVTLTSGSITGTGSLSATTLNLQGGSIANTLVIAGAAGITKTTAGTTTIGGLNTFTGPVIVQDGALSFDSIANADGTASALGAPTTAAAGAIRLGNAGTTGTLTYTGGAHSSDRQIDLVGSTGGGVISADGTGALVLTGAITSEEYGSKTLTLRGTSAGAILNKVTTPITECFGVLTLVKSGSNTWELDAPNTYTGATVVDEGILRPTVNQTMAGALVFGSANTIATTGTLDLGTVNATFSSLVVQTDTTNVNNILIGAGKTLTINGNVTIGTARAASTNTLITASGGGAMVVNNPAANGVFAVGGATTAASQGNAATANFSGLSALTINLDPATGVVRVNPTNANNVSDKFSVLTLPSTGAGTTTITANVLAVGDSSQMNGAVGQVNQLKLGSGVNTIQVNTVNVGTGSRDVGSVSFNTAAGSLVVRAADGTSRAAVNVGTGTASTGVAADTGNVVNLSGHNADLLLSTLTIGGQNRNTARSDAFTFDTGTLDATGVVVGDNGGTANTTAASTTWTSTLNLGGGTTIIGTGGLEIARGDTAVTGTDTIVGSVNVSGGTVTIANSPGLGAAVRLGNNTIATGLTTTGRFGISGGVVTVAGNIIRGATTGAGSATLTLNGGTLDMSNNSIGAASPVVTLNAESGALKNLGELNGGGTLTKTTGGTLVLEGVNTYTGSTIVSAGTLVVNNSNVLTGSGTGTGAVTVNATTTLAGNGSIAPASGNNITVDGILSIGAPGRAAGEDMSISLLGPSALTLNGTVKFAIFANTTAGSLDPVTSNDLLDINAPAYSNIVFGASSILDVTTALDVSTWQVNDAWKLIDWTAVGGTPPTSGFATINLPDLDTAGTSRSWDTSQLYTTGVVTITGVPEPGRAVLLLLGLLGLATRRRRDRRA